MTPHNIIAALAIICFVLAAFGVSARVSLTDVGLALFVVALVFVP